MNRLCVALLALLATTLPAQAQTGLLDEPAARFWSHEGYHGFLALGVAMPLLDGAGGRRQTARTLDTLLATGLLCQAAKALTRERRPDGSTHDSFPSGHATTAFAVAASQARYRGWQTPLWFAGALLIGDSRVVLKRHYPRDVVAGALLGVSGPRFGIVKRF